MTEMRAGRSDAPDESELGRDLTKGNFVSVLLQTETPALMSGNQTSRVHSEIKHSSLNFLFSSHNGSATVPVAPLSITSSRRGRSSRVSTRGSGYGQ